MENISTDNNHSIADHCYLFSESAQKDYRKRNAATPMSVATIVKL
jgi:hypothetical protein